MLWLFLGPVVCLLPAHLLTTVQEKELTPRFPHLNAIKLLLRRLPYACCFPFPRLIQLLVLSSAPHTLTLWKRSQTLWWYHPKLREESYMYALKTLHYITTQRSSQTFISRSIKYSTTWIFLLQNQIDHALLHICLCIHMQCLQLHVCMSMRPMVLSMICLIYGLDTLITH